MSVDQDDPTMGDDWPEMDSYDPAIFDDADPDAAERPHIKTAGTAQTIRALTEHITAGVLPDVYVTNGVLSALAKVSGDTDSAIDHSTGAPPLPVHSQPITVDSLAALLANHTVTTKRQKVEGEWRDVECTPPARVMSSVLTRTYWPGVRPLVGIVGSPVLRPDGTLLQAAGYDPKTSLYLAPKVTVPTVSDQPGTGEVAQARAFVLEEILSGFPWVEPADRANFLGLLVTQILRPYLQTITPFGLITATTQSSGKTLLSEIIGLLFGLATPTWGAEDVELRKIITTMLSGDARTIVWDNLKEGTAVDSPVLAQLLTAPVWSDRLLGGNKTLTAPNDRLWLATGNNIRLGGDMATRTVLVRLDPKMARPELRTEFEIPNLDVWIRQSDNRITLLRHLLILAVDWIAAGAPRSKHVMRQFTTWAAAVGGFCDHHSVGGFLDNADEVRDLDDEDEEWISFLHAWDQIIGTRPVTAKELLASAHDDEADQWDGRFLTSKDGKLPSPKSLGRFLRGHLGRPHGGIVIRAKKDNHRNAQVWWTEAMA